MAVYKCPFCKKQYVDKGALMEHLNNCHMEELHGLPPQQIYFNFTNKYALTKENGISVISGKPTKFNLVTCKFERFADEEDRQKFRQICKDRMKRVYGVECQLSDERYASEQEKKMLAARAISGTYTWEDGSKTTFTGSYERKFLEYLENFLGWESPSDIMAPAPMPIPYVDKEGKQRFHIPDFYITSLNLIVNIKSSENKHYRLRDIEDEFAQDRAIEKTPYNYCKIYDNEFSKFVKLIDTIRKNPKKRVLVESFSEFENNTEN